MTIGGAIMSLYFETLIYDTTAGGDCRFCGMQENACCGKEKAGEIFLSGL